MNPERARKSIKDFLTDQTDLQNRVFNTLAKEKFRELLRLQGKNPHQIKSSELNIFISDNYFTLQKNTDRLLEELCHKILPEKQWTYLLKQFGFLSIFLVPPLYPLGTYTAHMWTEYTKDPANLTALAETGVGIISGILLLMVLVSSIRLSYFKK